MRRGVRSARIGIAVMLVVTAAWSWLLLERTPDFAPGLGVAAVVFTIGAGVLLLAFPVRGGRRPGAISRTALVVGVASTLVGPLAYDVATASRAIAGGDPASGPNEGRFGSVTGAAIGGFGGPGPGTFDEGVSEELLEYLVANRRAETWLVAVTGAGQAAAIQLASSIPVMAMGGFSGMDPVPTLDQLQAYVRDGELRYVLAGGRGGPGGPGVSVAQARWLTSACTPVRVGTMEATLYDCASTSD